MFNRLTEKFQNLFTAFGKNDILNEKNISDAVREVRMALLDADVNYNLVSKFVYKVKEKALGQNVIKSVKPKQQFTKIIHDELVQLMGKEETQLNLDSKPSIIMLCGLQGSGKTTTSAKLAHFLQTKDKKVLLAACDLQRPAAIEQLKILGNQIKTEVFSDKNETKPIKVAKKAKAKAVTENFDVLIIDTAGRLHIDDTLMQELEQIKKEVSPSEVLFVANATTGQNAVKIASKFNEKMEITGTILTMLDGNARAGAAISISEVIKKPLVFEGIGEKIEDFQVFNPYSMADRILGKGDIINLVRKAEENMSEKESEKLEKKIKKASITFNDYLKQMKMMQKMGSVKGLMKMVPGMSSLGDVNFSDERMTRMKAMILSMTPNEREEKDEITYSRRKRIAQGSGTKIDDVNQLIKGFRRIKQFMKKMPNKEKGLKGMMPNIEDFKQQLGGNLWR